MNINTICTYILFVLVGVALTNMVQYIKSVLSKKPLTVANFIQYTDEVIELQKKTDPATREVEELFLKEFDLLTGKYEKHIAANVLMELTCTTLKNFKRGYDAV